MPGLPFSIRGPHRPDEQPARHDDERAQEEPKPHRGHPAVVPNLTLGHSDDSIRIGRRLQTPPKRARKSSKSEEKPPKTTELSSKTAEIPFHEARQHACARRPKVMKFWPNG